MLSVKCWCCGKSVRGGDDWAGRNAKCPNCSSDIYFPEAEQLSEKTARVSSLANINTDAQALGTSNVSGQDLFGLPRNELSGREVFGFERDQTAPRFPALRMIARAYEFLAVLAVVLSIAVMIFFLTTWKELYPDISLPRVLLLILFFTAVVTVSLLSIAQGLRLGLQIEENTRETAKLIAQASRRFVALENKPVAGQHIN